MTTSVKPPSVLVFTQVPISRKSLLGCLASAERVPKPASRTTNPSVRATVPMYSLRESLFSICFLLLRVNSAMKSDSCCDIPITLRTPWRIRILMRYPQLTWGRDLYGDIRVCVGGNRVAAVIDDSH